MRGGGGGPSPGIQWSRSHSHARLSLSLSRQTHASLWCGHSCCSGITPHLAPKPLNPKCGILQPPACIVHRPLPSPTCMHCTPPSPLPLPPPPPARPPAGPRQLTRRHAVLGGGGAAGAVLHRGAAELQAGPALALHHVLRNKAHTCLALPPPHSHAHCSPPTPPRPPGALRLNRWALAERCAFGRKRSCVSCAMLSGCRTSRGTGAGASSCSPPPSRGHAHREATRTLRRDCCES